MQKSIIQNLKPTVLLTLSVLLWQSCTPQPEASLLEGKINVTEPTEVAIVYDHEGDNMVEELTTDSTGAFIYNPELPGDDADVIIYVGQDIYGAYVKKGCSTHISIDQQQATFSGDNVDRCTFNNTLYHAFSPWVFKPTPDHPFNLNEWNTKLKQGYESAQKAAAAVTDSEARAHYQKLTDATYKHYYIQTLSLDNMMNHTDNEAEMDSLITTIDPNDDISRLSGLILYWYDKAGLHHSKGNAPGLTSYFIGQIAAVDSALTNEGNKKSLINNLCNMFFMYQPTDSAIEVFRTSIAPQLAKAPLIAQNIDKILAERANRIKDGDALPSNPTLIARDGSRTTLQQVIQGKVAYIDFWATWCAPCCREIPFFEKVWKQYEKNDQIIFVSISQDDNQQAWEKKMDKDQPGWPNYIFEKISGRKFLDAMGINAIPRFVIVGRDGKLITVDAARPSDKDIKAHLDAALAQ